MDVKVADERQAYMGDTYNYCKSLSERELCLLLTDLHVDLYPGMWSHLAK